MSLDIHSPAFPHRMGILNAGPNGSPIQQNNQSQVCRLLCKHANLILFHLKPKQLQETVVYAES
jgi:hypothetical protein